MTTAPAAPLARVIILSGSSAQSAAAAKLLHGAVAILSRLGGSADDARSEIAEALYGRPVRVSTARLAAHAVNTVGGRAEIAAA